MSRIQTTRRAVPVFLGIAALVSAAILLAWDAYPQLLPADARDLLGALPLVFIAVAYLAYEIIRRPDRAELLKATLLALAFLFWAGNQFWSESKWAPLMNDLAIGLFVLDVFFVMVGWPSSSPDEGFAEIYTAPAEGKAEE
jgi:uncharacterized membrane protein YoaK (UPF0700 family)